ncbi:MAG: retropepsin-like aspartic protease [Gammaproteobacteria bacterium]
MICSNVYAEQFDQHVPLSKHGASTFYVTGSIEGFGSAELLVDTGSGYVTLDEETFAILNKSGKAQYIKQLRGTMADGSERIVPIYRIAGIELGGKCYVSDVEVAIFPKKTRLILGLSALRKVSPFIFSMDDPPSLKLSNCGSPAAGARESLNLHQDQPSTESNTEKRKEL